MATLISTPHRLFRRRCACIFGLFFLTFYTIYGVSGAPSGRFGYVVSAKDRAQADADYQEGFAAYQAGDYAKALSLVEHADQLKPDQPDGWNLRGMIFLRQKAFAQAQTAFARAAALDPELWAARFNLAEILFQQKDYVRARKGFENLLSQTSRFKEANRWELVQYKTFLCCLLQGNAKEAEQKYARLPATGGVTPARLYADAALAYQGKKAVAAQKAVAAAQAAFPVQVNDLFADALVQAGWQGAPLPPAGLAGNPGMTTDAGLPPGVTLATSIPGHTPPPYYVVDPRLEAAVAEPLPLPDAGTHPIVGKLMPASQVLPVNAPAISPKHALTPVVASQTVPVPAATPDVLLEHRDLLMIE